MNCVGVLFKKEGVKTKLNELSDDLIVKDLINQLTQELQKINKDLQIESIRYGFPPKNLINQDGNKSIKELKLNNEKLVITSNGQQQQKQATTTTTKTEKRKAKFGGFVNGKATTVTTNNKPKKRRRRSNKNDPNSTNDIGVALVNATRSDTSNTNTKKQTRKYMRDAVSDAYNKNYATERVAAVLVKKYKLEPQEPVAYTLGGNGQSSQAARTMLKVEYIPTNKRTYREELVVLISKENLKLFCTEMYKKVPKDLLDEEDYNSEDDLINEINQNEIKVTLEALGNQILRPDKLAFYFMGIYWSFVYHYDGDVELGIKTLLEVDNLDFLSARIRKKSLKARENSRQQKQN